jgi:uncharacterized protein YraI
VAQMNKNLIVQPKGEAHMQSQPTKNSPDMNSLLIILLGLAGFLIIFLMVAIIYLYVSRPKLSASAEIPPATITSTPTFFPTSTSTSVITATETGVPTPMHPTVIPPTPAASSATALTKDYVHVRSGPGLLYPVYGLLPPQTQAEIVGISPDNQWWAVKVPVSTAPDGIGWINGQYITTTLTQGMPVITPPPLPEQVTIPTPPLAGAFVTTVEPVNVRSGPSTDYPVYGVAPLGTTAQAIGVSADGNWWEVSLPTNLAPNGTGWISAAYVTTQNVQNVPVIPAPPLPTDLTIQTPDDSEARLLTLEPVNVRSGPGSQYSSYGEMPANRRAKILGVSTDERWYQIALPRGISPDGTGWVNASFVVTFDSQGLLVIQP